MPGWQSAVQRHTMGAERNIETMSTDKQGIYLSIYLRARHSAYFLSHH